MGCRMIFLFLRWPEEGQVKTRLARSIGPHKARELYVVMAEDIALRLAASSKAMNYRLIFYVTPESRFHEFEWWLSRVTGVPAIDVLPQPEGELGWRLETAMEFMFRHGATEAYFIGTDCPEFSIRHLEQASKILQEKDAVFGPAADGGFYLLGLRREIPGLLQSAAYSEESTREELAGKMRDAGLSVSDHTLPLLHDVDEVEDLQQLSPETCRRLMSWGIETGTSIDFLSDYCRSQLDR